jgi:predicted DNA-binding transcriptional regulator AlpA
MVDGMTARYLSLKEVGERLHVKNAAAYRLPEPDALIGTTRGWLPETIDQWNARRPGRGVGGGRPRKKAE